jgi:predicted RNase H-like HicB family nuclease
MDIPVLIEPVADGFRARGGEPFAFVAEGSTPDEALTRLKKAVQHQLEAGATVVSMHIPSGDHPWLPFAGMFQEHDPIIQKWLQVLESQRK